MTAFSSRASMIWLIVILGFAGSLSDSGAQEEDLQRALADQERRMAGLKSLTETLKGWVEWIPGVGGDDDEEMDAYTEAMSSGTEVRSVKLTEGEGTDTGAEASVALADGEGGSITTEELYRRNLQEAATKLNIAGAFPKTKQILIGAQKLNVGENIAIAYDGNLFELTILDITAEELKLRDRKTQAELEIEIGVTEALPPGMFRKPPPGMLPKIAPEGTPPPPASPAPPTDDR